MKRTLFYVLLVVQLLVILFLTIQFEQIDEVGQKIKLQTIKPDYPIYDSAYENNMYVEYEINQISFKKWNKPDSVDYNTSIYVLLKSDKSGIYHVEKVSVDKLTTEKENEVVLTGTYRYSDDILNYHYVSYGMERIKQTEQFGMFQGKNSFIISILIGKWGQHKITAIEKVD